MPRLRLPSLLLLASAALMPTLAPAQRAVVWGDSRASQWQGLRPIHVSAGYAHNIAIQPDGSLYIWGLQSYGIGQIPEGLVATQTGAGTYHCVALRSDGRVVAWGDNTYDQCNVPAGLVATQVVAWSYGGLALRTDGTVASWGNNYFGQGNVPADLVATQVAASSSHALAVRPNGTVVAWGNRWNDAGQLNVPAGLVATQLAAGYLFSIALRPDGTVGAWGYNDRGQCNVPAGLKDVIGVTAGNDHALVLRSDGTVVAWGSNEKGQTNVPAGLTGVLQVAAGQGHSVALVAAAHCVLDQSEIAGGGSATGTVKLAHPAPAGGAVVELTSDDPATTVPATVTVPEGESQRTFPVSTVPFGPDRTVTIRTSYNGTATVPTRLRVGASTAALSFATAIVGGTTLKPALTLSISTAQSADVILALASSDPAVTVPASVTMPAGQTSVTINLPTTLPVSTTTAVAVTATHNGATVASTTLTVNPFRASILFDAPTLPSGESAMGTVVLSGVAVQAKTVALASGDPAVTVPASVTVRAGTKIAYFSISSSPVATNRTVPVTATVNGNSFSVNLRLLAAPAVKSLTLPASLYGNGKITGTVRLTQAAKAGGTVVSLSSSDSALRVPATVTVPEGQYSATFQASSSDVAALTNLTVTAATGTGSATVGVAVKPLTITSFTVSPTTATSNSTLTIFVKLAAPVAVDTVVSLTSAEPGLVPVPATVTIPAGRQTATVTVPLGSIAITKFVRITADKPGSSLYRTLKITP
ncbi:hypothetical protein EON79_11550 [bacterium]|nr:MAG: hypothetical protein EON79_11550 [bacterium]